MKKEVSCQATNLLVQFLIRKKVDLKKFFEDFPYDADYFLDKNNWIDYETLLKFYEKIERNWNAPDTFVDIGRHVFDGKVFGFVTIMAQLLASPLAMYKRFPYFVNSMFRVVECHVRKESSDGIVLEYTFHPNYKPTQAFFDLTKGILEATAKLVGFRLTRVVMEQKEMSCQYSLTWEGRPALYRRIWYFLVIRPFTVARAIADLTESHRTLEQKYDEVNKLNVALQGKIHELQETQQQLIQAGKMVAVGELASGVIHEVESPLNAIQGYSQILQEELQEGELHTDTLKESLENIENACLRMRKTTQHLRSFAYPKPVFAEVDVNNVIESAITFFEPQARKYSMTITRNLTEGLPPITAEATQLEQVLLNLFNNARDAMAKVEYPELHISSHLVDGAVEIEVKDNGPGIAHDVQKKIFDPFFTTKEMGKGTGLGLAICQRIIKAHSGRISLKSSPGQGTSFIISIPLKREQIAA